MFKINQSAYDDVVNQLEVNLKKTASEKVLKNDNKLVEALELLNKSANTLDQLGFEKEAEILTKLITVASEDMNSAGDNFPHLDHFPSAEHGYPVIYLTDKDNVLCADCAKEVQEEGGKVSAHIYEEGPTHNCEICDAPLESAYGDPSEPDEGEKSTNEDMNSAGDNFPHLDHFPSAAHGYPVIYLTDKDNVLCADCAKQVQEEGGKVSAHVYEEGPTHNCEICDAPLESAYGDPSEPDKDEKPTKDQEYNKMLLELDDNDTHDQVFI